MENQRQAAQNNVTFSGASMLQSRVHSPVFSLQGPAAISKSVPFLAGEEALWRDKCGYQGTAGLSGDNYYTA